MSYERKDAVAHFFYGYEEYEEILVFPPTAGEVAGVESGWMLGVHGGLFFNPGHDPMSMNGTGFSGVADELRAQGCYVFVIDHQPTACNSVAKWTPFSFKLWPGPLMSVLRALAWILSNRTWDSEFGPQFLTSASAALSKTKSAAFGSSSGADLCMLAGLIPPGRFPIDGVVGIDTDTFALEDYPRPRVVVNKIGQISWPCYVFPTDGGFGATYDGDNHQALSTNGGIGPWLNWTETPMRIKRGMSPVHWLRAGYPGNKNTAFYHHYLNSPSQYGPNFVASDWDADTPLDDFAGGKALADPHDRLYLWGAAKEWTLAGVPNRCVLGVKPVTYDKATDTWITGANIVNSDVAADTVAYILGRWSGL